ncbi:hypothetical protein NL676_038445 [Syzygium grande]|nr:hypothetical protein NL676_038445 [Syzygium grande]
MSKAMAKAEAEATASLVRGGAGVGARRWTSLVKGSEPHSWEATDIARGQRRTSLPDCGRRCRHWRLGWRRRKGRCSSEATLARGDGPCSAEVVDLTCGRQWLMGDDGRRLWAVADLTHQRRCRR